MLAEGPACVADMDKAEIEGGWRLEEMTAAEDPAY